MQKTRTYIIVLNYNGWQDTIECLESLYRLTQVAYQVIVCDNASKGNDVHNIATWAQKNKIPVVVHEDSNLDKMDAPEDALLILRARENKGYSAGNNIGLRYAQTRRDFAYVWVLNNDTTVADDSLDKMVKAAQKENADGVGSVVCDYLPPRKVQLVGSKANLSTRKLEFIGEGADPTTLPNNLEITLLHGPSFLLTAKFVRQIKFFDARYFLYCEELDLAERAKVLGAKFIYAHDAYVFHKGGASIGKKGKNYTDYCLARSWTIFFGKFHPELLPDLQRYYQQRIKRKMKHLHFFNAQALRKGLREGLQVLYGEKFESKM